METIKNTAVLDMGQQMIETDRIEAEYRASPEYAQYRIKRLQEMFDNPLCSINHDHEGCCAEMAKHKETLGL